MNNISTVHFKAECVLSVFKIELRTYTAEFTFISMHDFSRGYFLLIFIFIYLLYLYIPTLNFEDLLFLQLFQSINQLINKFILRHSTEARATVRLCRIKEKGFKTDLKCVNGWSSSTVQRKRVPMSRSLLV